MEIKFRLRLGKKIVGYCKWSKRSETIPAGWKYANPITHLYVHAIKGGFIKHDEKDFYVGMKDKHGHEVFAGDNVKNEFIAGLPHTDSSEVHFDYRGAWVDVVGKIAGRLPLHKLGKFAIIGNKYISPKVVKDKGGSDD